MVGTFLSEVHGYSEKKLSAWEVRCRGSRRANVLARYCTHLLRVELLDALTYEIDAAWKVTRGDDDYDNQSKVL